LFFCWALGTSMNGPSLTACRRRALLSAGLGDRAAFRPWLVNPFSWAAAFETGGGVLVSLGLALMAASSSNLPSRWHGWRLLRIGWCACWLALACAACWAAHGLGGG